MGKKVYNEITFIWGSTQWNVIPVPFFTQQKYNKNKKMLPKMRKHEGRAMLVPFTHGIQECFLII